MKFRLLEDANRYLGRNSSVPSKESVVSGNAEYAGLPLVYKPNLHAEAENFTTEIWVSDKFFNQPVDSQRHILNHEVAHNWSDELMQEHLDDWGDFASIFIQEKKVPESSASYQRGARTYWEGLYGDIGATALSETTTIAIVEYLDNPDRLKKRSEEAFDVIKEFVDRKF